MPRLEIRSPPALLGQTRELRDTAFVLGRSSEVDWSLDDPHVSRRHAVILPGTAGIVIEDLRSTAGTWVNGRRVSGRCPLRDGDVVRLATVELEYVADRRGAARFDVDSQYADVVNNVGRDQYLQQVFLAREDAFGHLDSTSRVGRFFFLLGFSLAGAGILTFIGTGALQATGAATDPGDPRFDPSGELISVSGIPLIAICLGVALVGFALCITGVVIGGTVSHRRKEIDKRYPLPPFTTR